MKRECALFICLAAMTFLVGTAIGQEHAKPETSSKASADAAPFADKFVFWRQQRAAAAEPHAQQARQSTKSEQSERAEGEQRFRENCGRCHQPPHKFPPRVMAAAIRHMRVRAMLTDEDMRLILKYMTQ